jgi:hypothetical protein
MVYCFSSFYEFISHKGPSKDPGDVSVDPGGRNGWISDLEGFEKRREGQRGRHIDFEEDNNGGVSGGSLNTIM